MHEDMKSHLFTQKNTHKKTLTLSPSSCSENKLVILGEGEADLTRQVKNVISVYDVWNPLCIHVPAGLKTQISEIV